MIEVTTESLIPLHDVPRRLPPRCNGKRIHISAVYRWIQRGVRGVRLESVKIGGTGYTTAEALQRFADQLTQHLPLCVVPAPAGPAYRSRQVKRATLNAIAILGSARKSPQ
jgi:hypothetical protein